jgi:hypothetical protein
MKLPKKGALLLMASAVPVRYQGKDPNRDGFVLISTIDCEDHNTSIGEDEFKAALESGFYRVEDDG